LIAATAKTHIAVQLRVDDDIQSSGR